MICEECGVPATHAETFYERVRYWCERHTPWSGHFEYCGDGCARLLRVVGVPNQRCAHPHDAALQQGQCKTLLLRDRLERAANTLFEQIDLDVEHEIQSHADTLPGRLRQLHGILLRAWEIVTEGTQDVG